MTVTTMPGAPLDDRVRSLRRAADLADGRLDQLLVDDARIVADIASERTGLGSARTVVAIAGPTGSGKSSLFNALCGEAVAAIGVRRPTTGMAQACVWGSDTAGQLLDWLRVYRRHSIVGEEALDGLVLLDLPDHDSVLVEHRYEMERLAEVVDVIVWVTDPEKYADEALHGYLRRLAGYDPVMLVTLNKADLLSPDELELCAKDLRRLLVDDGLPEARVVTASILQNRGVDQVREALREWVTHQREGFERVGLDITTVSSALLDDCGPAPGPNPTDDAGEQLVDALTATAGGSLIERSVSDDYRSQAGRRTGWPLLRWLRRPRRQRARSNESSSRDLVGPAQRVVAGAAVRSAAERSSVGMSDTWTRQARKVASEHEPALWRAVEGAVEQITGEQRRRPLWWSLLLVVQWLLALVAIAGGVAVVAYWAMTTFELADVSTPEVRGVSVPLALFLGGVGGGVVVASVGRVLAALGARRRGRRARASLQDTIAAIVRRELVRPLHDELTTATQLASTLRHAAGRSSSS